MDGNRYSWPRPRPHKTFGPTGATGTSTPTTGTGTGTRTAPSTAPVASTPPSWLDASSIMPFDKPLLATTTVLSPQLATTMLYPDNDIFTFQPKDDPPALDLSNLSDGDIRRPRSRPLSMISSASASSTGSMFSCASTESETMTVVQRSRDPSPYNKGLNSTQPPAASPSSGKTFTCNWAGCELLQRRFATHADLVWHVKEEHLLVCPALGCVESEAFGSARMVKAHVAVAHPEVGGDEGVKEWQLAGDKRAEEADERVKEVGRRPLETTRLSVGAAKSSELEMIRSKKRKCQEKLQTVVEKKAKRATDSQSIDSQASRCSDPMDTASFPMVWEHAVLPFLIEFIPKWSTPRHVISVVRGKAAGLRRISITTQTQLSRSRKVIIAKHVRDLMPPKFQDTVSFVFSVGDVVRARATWARGLGKDLRDDICSPRNPYYFRSPCMGDSIGIEGTEAFEAGTATLGPCITLEEGSFWLANFHPFIEAYKSGQTVQVEHPSPQDRARCIEEGHDAMADVRNFKVGDLTVTSGWDLRTTRISHDPYWEDCGKEQPLVVTDWALITASSSSANMLRHFPSEAPAHCKEQPLVTSTGAVNPGSVVISSGRTSGFQHGQICEIPAYVGGEENGTQKATREWFIEEPDPYDNEEAWIRGGIGVEGDSGAAVIDAESNDLVGQIWGRNRYWGPGPRHTFFTPISDLFDDIQERCLQQTRPHLPQHRDEAERFPEDPSCRQCYDLRTYLDSRRSSRMSLQSMIIGQGGGEGDQDLTSIEAVSELATPRDYFPRGGTGLEEVGASFNSIFSPGQMGPTSAGTPVIADLRSPYAQTLELDDAQETAAQLPSTPQKRSAPVTEAGATAKKRAAPSPTSSGESSEPRKRSAPFSWTTV